MAGYYPPVGFHFRVDFGVPGLQADEREGRFQEVSGLEMSIKVQEEEIGGLPGLPGLKVKLPNGPETGSLTLKRGMLNGSKLRPWFETAYHLSVVAPVPVTVVLLNEQHQPLASWLFIGSWPCKWSWSNLDADKSELVVETIEVKYQYMLRLL